MIYYVKVQGACSCYLKTGLPEISQFDSEEQAKNEAEYIFGIMNSTFCHKHKFDLIQSGNEFIINITNR